MELKKITAVILVFTATICALIGGCSSFKNGGDVNIIVENPQVSSTIK